MAHQRSINALLTDLDGVIRRWDGQDAAAIECDTGLPAGSITATAFDPELLLPAITGRVTDEGWRVQIAERLRECHPGADVDRAMTAWFAPTGEVDAGVLKLVQAARQQVPVVLITNATTRLNSDLAALGILDAFDHIVNSSAVGAAKPDRAIFEHALGLLEATAAETLYVDDTERYLGPARALGLVTHRFTGIDHLRAAFAGHGLAT